MPISSNTTLELKKITAQFDFLLTVSNIKIKNIPPDQRFCVICQSPFDNNVWKFGDTVNRPVKLDCGHIFGIQCLAHLVFTSDFSNRCPLCRAQLMPDSFEKNPSGQSWKAAVPLLRLLMMFGGDVTTFSKKKALDVLQNGLEREGLMGPVPGKHMHRIMILYEEFLSQFCNNPQPTTGDAHRLADAEARVEELLDVIGETQDLRREMEEARASRAQLEEIARNERENELRDVKAELEEVRKQEKETHEEVQSLRKKLERAGNEELDAAKELEGVNEKLKDATRSFEETLKELEETKKDLHSVASSALVFILLGMTIALIMVRFEGHIFGVSTTFGIVLGLWLVLCIVAVVRSRPTRRSWMFFGLVVFCVALGMGAFSERDRFAL